MYNKYIILFFLAMAFLTACKGDKTKEGIIDRATMTNLMTDVIIIDGTLYNVVQAPDTIYKYGTGRYLALFKKYNTDSARFDKSFKYYATQPTDIQAIFDQVLLNIQKKTDSLNKIQLKQNALPKKQY